MNERLERTRMPMVVSDPRESDNPIILANEAFLEMCGYEREEVLGRNCRFLHGPDTSRAAVAEIRRSIAAEKEVTVELLNYRKDGSSFWSWIERLRVSFRSAGEGNLCFCYRPPSAARLGAGPGRSRSSA